MDTLTRTAQVLQVLKTGGRVEPAGDAGLLRLRDINGRVVPAWQTAMKTAELIFSEAHLKGAAVSLILAALDDLKRGDRLDAIDALVMAAEKLRESRAIGMGKPT